MQSSYFGAAAAWQNSLYWSLIISVTLLSNQAWQDFAERALADLNAAGRLRVLRQIESAVGPSVRIGGRDLLLCCSNDYLGLANDARLKAAALAATERWGAGSGASRLIAGSLTPHAELESKIADWKRAEAALLFNSGYQANVGVLQALLGPGDFVYSDALNHASLIDGCRLSRAVVRVYRHGDAAHLAELLQADAKLGGKRLIVSDSVFSMDADEAPLAALCDLAERYGAWLMLDEAHAAGLLGDEGAGLASDLGLSQRVHIQMGTLGKALGSFGAYIAGSRRLIDLLINRARSFVFTTALPPAVAAASSAAIDIVRGDSALRRRALARGSDLRRLLAEQGRRVLPGRAPIVPVLVGRDDQTMALAQKLYTRGVFAVGIRPPTVPEGGARIRLTVSAAHSPAQIQTVAEAFRGA